MSLSLETLDFLASAAGAALLDELSHDDLTDTNTLTLLTKLRRTYAPEQAGAALELARLRRVAVAKFGVAAARLFFTQAALEQASHPLVRAYRARQIGAEPLNMIDAGCGIGADALAFAVAGHVVLGLDIDPLRVALARLNAAALDLDARFEVADVRAGLPPADVVFFDPARRDAAGQRIFHVEHYEPPLSIIREWPGARVVVKLSPGVDLAQLAAYPGSVEFISVAGDLKEAVLWRGDDSAAPTRATLLSEANTYHWPGPSQADAHLSEPRGWLVEPDPALIRAGLVTDAAAAYGGRLLDPTIAYFTTDSAPDSPWLRSWQILDWLPFNLKKLRAYLRERGVGSVTVKKRGTAVTPAALIPRLKLKGDATRTLVLTRCKDRQIVLICA